MAIGLILESLVALLLMITVVYCFQLDRRLRALRNGQDGLKDLIKGLGEATGRAQLSVAQLKIAGDAAGRELRDTVTKARELADELSLMVEAGNNIADRLEGGATAVGGRQVSDSGKSKSFGSDSDRWTEETDEKKSDGDKNLMQALREAR